MNSSGAITNWVNALKEGDSIAAQQLWERYFHRLVGMARLKLRGRPRVLADEEDVALSAFGSFCRNAEQGKFPQLEDRDDLWPLLVKITARKACRLIEHENCLKRGGDGGKDPTDTPPVWNKVDLATIVDTEPTPEFAAQVADEWQHLLDLLPSDELREVAQLRTEGYTMKEIVEKQHSLLSAVERQLRIIRKVWEKELHQ